MTVADPTVSEVSERDLIARIRARLPAPPDWMPVGIGDDAAVVEPERNRLEVLTTDALVESVHFDRAFTPPAAIGHRALAVNLSDIASMGADPRLALISFILPPALPLADFDGIVGGLTQLAERHRVHIAGGNLARSPGPLVIDVTVTGFVKRRRALTRAGARPGDELYVTGSIGSAAAGLAVLRSGQGVSTETKPCVERYLFPAPRLRSGALAGRNRAAAACMDLSDGLADAVRQVAEASGVGAVVDEEALPILASARAVLTDAAGDAIGAAISGGDDYELLFAVRPRARRRFLATVGRIDPPVTRIGVCTADRSEVVLRGTEGVTRPLPSGYGHFR